ncbi:unnamed protein product, partial [Heterotrigona itama]
MNYITSSFSQCEIYFMCNGKPSHFVRFVSEFLNRKCLKYSSHRWIERRLVSYFWPSFSRPVDLFF